MGQGSSCWGCFQSTVDMHMKLAEVLPKLEIKYWAAVVDYKISDLENYPDKSIDIGLYEGTARTEDDVHLLKTFRAKCKTLVALGSCSVFGGVPGMANFFDFESCLDAKFRHEWADDGGRIPTDNVPPFIPILKPNKDYVDIDVFLPGCPPEPKLIYTALTALIEGKKLDLPPYAVCHYCSREKKETPLTDILRPYQGVADPKRCLLEQGYICLGSATWGLCEGACVNKGTPCRGCYGPPPPIMQDQGAAVVGMLGTYAPLDPETLKKKVVDPLGTFWRFTYPTSFMGSIRLKREEVKSK
ncbi:MAG: F420-nonreducing hydrogenase [Candidatus Thorarchaeota archaeon]